MSTFTTVVHRNDPHDVYIGRPSKWGNPFKVGTPGARDECITLYEQWILTQPQLLAALPELHGKRIACHCAPQPCHGDVLARLANELPPAAGATPASGAPQRESQVRIGMTGSRTWTDSETVLKALQWAAKRFQADSKFTLQRANRTPVPLDTPGFEVLTEHQPRSPEHTSYCLIVLYTY